MPAMATKKKRTPKAEKPRIGRPPSGEPERDKIAQTRLNQEEHNALAELADAEGIAPGTWLRNAVRKAAKLDR